MSTPDRHDRFGMIRQRNALQYGDFRMIDQFAMERNRIDAGRSRNFRLHSELAELLHFD